MKSLAALLLTVTLATIALAQRAQNNTDEKLQARNAPDVFFKILDLGSWAGRQSRQDFDYLSDDFVVQIFCVWIVRIDS